MINGVITALVTPMNEDGEIDYISLNILLEQQISSGVVAIVINGSTGEAASLTTVERLELIKYVINYVNNRIRVMVGIGHSGTRVSLELLAQLELIDGIYSYMVLTPPYVKPTQEGLYLHFATIAKATQRPIIIYNVPGRTACNIEDVTVIKLASDYANIVGIKDATGNIARCAYLVKNKPENFVLYSGDDETCLAFILLGGNGVISVTSNVLPRLFIKMVNYALSQQLDLANMLNRKLVMFAKLMLIETNPIPVKWCLHEIGIIKSDQLRLPLTRLTESSILQLRPLLLNLYQEERSV